MYFFPLRLFLSEQTVHTLMNNCLRGLQGLPKYLLNNKGLIYFLQRKVSQDSQPLNARIQLDDVKSEEEIDSLDIKSLKRLLLNNFVDYKGCKEKWELQERLRRLWRDNQANKKLCKFKSGKFELCPFN